MRAVTALAAALASTASASELCAVVSDVTTIAAAGGCTVAGSTLLFNNFQVSPSSGFTGARVGISGSGTSVVGSDVDLAFQFGGLTGPGVATASGDIQLLYTVQGGLSGVDIMLQASPVTTGGQMTVGEVACSAGFVGGACSGTTLAGYSVSSSGAVETNQDLFSPPYGGEVWMKKTVIYNGATPTELINSQIVPTPEPMTFPLVSAGLLGLGLLRRATLRN
jgi:hypothetical protein